MKHLTTAVVILMLGLTAVFAQNTGKTKGWPTAQLAKWGLPNLKQPAGVQSSYTFNPDEGDLMVYMTGANKNTFQGLKQQIEKVAGEPMVRIGEIHTQTGIKQGSGWWHIYIPPFYTVWFGDLEGNLLSFRVFFDDGPRD